MVFMDELSDELNMGLNDALFRIKRDIQRTNGNMYLSFSGGKDSTVLAQLIQMGAVLSGYGPLVVDHVHINTGLELESISRFVDHFGPDWYLPIREIPNFEYKAVKIKEPKMKFNQIIKEYGKPVLSKLKSEHLATHQKHFDDPLGTTRQKHLILGEQFKEGKPLGKRTQVALAMKHFHFLHEDLGYQISNKCCDILKKRPAEDIVKEGNYDGVFIGVRTAEGGARSLQYKSCILIKEKRGKEFYTSMPIIDWTDEMVEEFIDKFNLEISEAYTLQGFQRTGCFLCPFGRTIQDDLKIIYETEPNRYKAAMHWMRDIYIDQDIICYWDDDYMMAYEQRRPLIIKMRKEMVDKYSLYFNPDIRKKAKLESEDKQMSLF
ncbi:MAG: phosphoadenosine phosphosulfate reductase family protein [Lactococcus lactis]|jgi:3'-phosphoadenosine 5'-phosphosulfate sulfotransferase (PAPS reductase)/FAD synthetase|nr:phosphoadenosine phosphosulfate reductase family protein [Lactococcus lactis]